MKKLTSFSKRFNQKVRKGITVGSYGQTEMLGLVIIVILIVIAALFYVRFAVFGNKGESQQKENVLNAIQAYNLMNAIMNVKVCTNVSIREGISLCKNNGYLCDENACTYLDKEIDSIVKMSIYRDYSFNVSSSGWSYSLKECKYGTASYPYIYNLNGDTFKAFFKICQDQIDTKTNVK